MPTVQQLARELGLTSQEVMTRLKALGRPADGHLSQVEDQAAERLRREKATSSPVGDATSETGRDAAATSGTTPGGSPPPTATAGRTGARKTTARSPSKKTTAKKTTTRPAPAASTGDQQEAGADGADGGAAGAGAQTPSQESTAKKTTAKATGAKKTTAKKTTAASPKKTTAKTTAAKKATAKKTTAKKTTGKKTTAKKTTAKKTTARGVAQDGPADAQAPVVEGQEDSAQDAQGPQAQPDDGAQAAPGTEPAKPKRRFGIFPRRRKGAEGESKEQPAKAKPKPEPPKPKGQARKKWLKRLTELPVLVLIAFLVAIVIKTFLVQAFFIPSGSMRPTLAGGQRVLVEKLSYLFSNPDRGDVVVFARSDAAQKVKKQAWYDDARNFMKDLIGLPTPGTTDYIKRIAAVGGDTLSYEGSPRVLTVNGKRIKEPYLTRPDTTSPAVTGDSCRNMQLEPVKGGCRVPAGTVFVLGDNRDQSQDSRFIGPVKEEKIIGRAFVVIWPVEDLAGL